MTMPFYKNSPIVPDDEAPRLDGTLLTTGDERRSSASRTGQKDVTKSKPQGSLITDVAKSKREGPRFTKIHKIGTWNVRTMNQGKLDIVKAEMQRTKLDLLGISELKWTGMGHFDSDDYKVFYSGHEKYKRNGVALILRKELARHVIGYNPINDRIISIRISGHPVNINIIQVYAPTYDAEEEVVNDFYGKVQEAIDATPKKDLLVIIGDWNAKVGEGTEPGVTGRFGLGRRNDAGDRLVDFCEENSLFIANTYFSQHRRRLYTWTSPDGQHRNQIDFVIGNKRWRSTFQAAKTLPGADCGSDHELLMAEIKVKLKKMAKTTLPIRLDLENISSKYSISTSNRFQTLNLCETEPEELWHKIKEIIITEAEGNIPLAAKTKGPKWLSNEAIKIAEERRKMKALGKKEETRKLNADFQRQARKDKEAFLNEECQKIEEHNRQGRTRDLFKKIRDITGNFHPKLVTIKNDQGRDLIEAKDIKERWKNFAEKLYSNDNTTTTTFPGGTFSLEPVPLESEVRWSIKQIKNNKAPGYDNIPIELLKAAGDEGIRVLTALCQQIWTKTTWPRDWKQSIFLPLYKKGDPKECSNYRTIALISHASKILLKIIQKRLEPFLERELPKEQAGFRKNRGTRDQIANIRWIMEKTKEFKKPVYFCFIDYSKAFDCVDHNKMWEVLKSMGVPDHLTLLLRNLYNEQEATVKTDLGNTEWFKIMKGVRQGCILSPHLFNLYTEHIMRSAGLNEMGAGIHIGGEIINNLRYADDTTLLAESKKDLEELIGSVKKESEKFGLKLNVNKTKVMSTFDLDTFKIDGTYVEVVKSFTLLGSRIECNGDCSGEIKRRILMGKKAMTGLSKIMKDNDISMSTKIRIVRSMVFPIMLYGCESWTLKKIDKKKIEAFELWTWRRLLRIPWTAKRTNKFVLDVIKPNIPLEALICKQKLSYFGHVMRANGLEKQIMCGKIEGRRQRGRPSFRWIDGIKDICHKTLEQLRELTNDRLKWRAFVHEVTRSRPRLDGS